jgi:hypothetical protein
MSIEQNILPANEGSVAVKTRIVRSLEDIQKLYHF